jgi:hypothetical protein
MICQSPVLVGYSDTSYTYGLFLDGVTSYENLTGQFNDKATVKLTDDPNVTAKEYEDYKMLFSDTITIQVNGVFYYFNFCRKPHHWCIG